MSIEVESAFGDRSGKSTSAWPKITAEAVRNGARYYNLDGTPDAIDDAWVAANIPEQGCNTVADLRSQLAAAGLQYKAPAVRAVPDEPGYRQLTKRLVEDVAPDLVDVLRQAMLEKLRDQLRPST